MLKEADSSSNLQFGGLIFSAIGVGINDIGTRNTGAGTAGLSNLWTNHYQITMQAQNYGKASQALTCMHQAIDSVDDRFWDMAYDRGTFKFDKSFFLDLGLDKTEADNAYKALPGMFANLNQKVVEIDQKLRKLQASVSISNPSTESIKAAAAGEIAAQKTADSVNGKTEYTPAMNQKLQSLTSDIAIRVNTLGNYIKEGVDVKKETLDTLFKNIRPESNSSSILKWTAEELRTAEKEKAVKAEITILKMEIEVKMTQKKKIDDFSEIMTKQMLGPVTELGATINTCIATTLGRD